MKKRLNFSLYQMDVIPARPDLNFENIKKHVDWLVQSSNDSVDVLVLPELCLSGYLIGDLYEEESFLDDCTMYGDMIAKLTKDTKLNIVFGNIKTIKEQRHTDGRALKYNSVFVATGGYLKPICSNVDDEHYIYLYDFQPKALLPNYREFEEPRHFSTFAKLCEKNNTTIDKMLMPFEVNGVKIGLTICEDGWDADYNIKPMNILKKNGAEIILNLSCSPFTLGKNNSRNRVFGGHAKELGIPVVYVNSVGLQNNGKTIYTFDGSSIIYNKYGEVMHQCKKFDADVWHFVYERGHIEGIPMEQELLEEDETEMIYNALVYGIRKYMAMSRLERVVIGSSGGVDSAVSAALYADAIGAENVYLVNMPSEYNSDTTKNLSMQLAENLGCPYMVVPISESVKLTKKQLDGNIFVKNGQAIKQIQLSDFNLENVQARDRSSRVLAGIASTLGAVFTNNGNKSETTVGYATLYGDVCGFLATIADLWKEQVYDLGRYINDLHQKEIIPVGIFNIVACAELSANQNVDAGKGDPIIYWYHDKLFRAFVERWNRATPADILNWYASGTLAEKIGLNRDISTIFKTDKEFIDDLERWWNLFKGMAVAKRVQAPPVLAISRRAFGFDYRESLNCVYFSSSYQMLKERLLTE